MNAFTLSFGVILLAELGDKSQLMALAFASCYRAWTVLIAVSIATLIVHAGSVLLGSIKVFAAAAFVVFEGVVVRRGPWNPVAVGRSRPSSASTVG